MNLPDKNGAATNAEIKGGSSDQTLRSTFIMGGSSVMNILLGIVRNKVIALLINPSGMGLMGVYQSISNLALTVSGLGVSESGTRKVALDYRAGDLSSISHTSLLLRRIALVTGLGGTVLMVLLSDRIGLMTFHNREHNLDIALLSLSVLFGTISGAQVAIIQGVRKISYLAKINVLGALWGTVVSLPIIYYFRMRGIVSYLIIMALTTLATSWWYRKKIPIPVDAKAKWRYLLTDAKPLMGLGIALMIGTIIIFGTSYVLRILIIRHLGMDAAGQFQASSILSTVYVGLIFKAMGTDFFPRLSALSMDDQGSRKLVNEQIEAGLLLAVPGVLFTLTFAPLILKIFYSNDFLPAIHILRWQILGVLLQTITWPMGYMLRAKASGGLFIGTEIYSGVCYIVATWIGIKNVGLEGIGIAYFAYNLLYLVLIYGIVHKKYSFSFISKSYRVMLIALIATAGAFSVAHFVSMYSVVINGVIILATSAYSYKQLDLSKWIARIIKRLRRKA